ncbi:unnamed protein product [Musa textilis]
MRQFFFQSFDGYPFITYDALSISVSLFRVAPLHQHWVVDDKEYGILTAKHG